MTTTYLLVGHGSRGRGGNAETERFAQMWRQRHPDWRIELCFIEHADVLLDTGFDRAATGAERVVVLPFILNAAGHVKMELPHALEEARARHPAVEFVITRHLGMGPEMRDILQDVLRGLAQQLAVPDPQTTGVILLGRGSSDAGANGELAKMARWLFEANDYELVDLAFTGVTWPRLESVVQRQARLGMMQIAIVPVYLFSGVLIERILAQVARLRAQYPHIHFALGGHFGFAPGIFALVDARATNTADAAQQLDCDGCKYRELAEEEHLHDHSHTHCEQGHHHGHSHDHQHDHAHHDHPHAGCAHAHHS